jgi:hypothetical protein
MGMLDRIKKRQLDGFKEFVLNMETTTASSRQHILMTGILEDPVFMTHVMKNVRTFDDFLNLPIDEIDLVLRSQEQIMGVFAKCVHGLESDTIGMLEGMIPKYISKLKDELSYLKEVSPSEKEGAKYFILKAIRKLQMQESIQVFSGTFLLKNHFIRKSLKTEKPRSILKQEFWPLRERFSRVEGQTFGSTSMIRESSWPRENILMVLNPGSGFITTEMAASSPRGNIN